MRFRNDLGDICPGTSRVEVLRQFPGPYADRIDALCEIAIL